MIVSDRKAGLSREAVASGEDALTIAGRTFQSRLIIGSARYPNPDTMLAAIEASGADMVTVAVRRVNLDDRSQESILSMLDRARYFILPNTAGCFTAKEAVLTAHLAREALDTPWVKLEVTPDPRYLLPDPVETLHATEKLVQEGFTVLPYMPADPVLAKRLLGEPEPETA